MNQDNKTRHINTNNDNAGIHYAVSQKPLSANVNLVVSEEYMPLLNSDLDTILEVIRVNGNQKTRLDAVTSLIMRADEVEERHIRVLQKLYDAEKDMAVATEIKRLLNKIKIHRVLDSDPTEQYDRKLTTEEEKSLQVEIEKLRTLYDQAKKQKGAFDNTYKIIGLIRKGGWGSIFKATRLADNKDVIVKILTREKLADQTEPEMIIARFRREADLLINRLTHPHIIEAYDHGHHNGEYYTIMEYLQDGDINDWLKKKTLSLKQFLLLACQLCSAVEYIHGKGVIHRDINPNNIMIVKNNETVNIKLIDFGLARDKRDDRKLTCANVGMGTEGFMSPQQVTEAGLADERDDIYSIGKTFYQMLAGHEQLGDDDYKPLELGDTIVSKKMDDIIRKCIQHKKEDRWQNIKELREALDRAL